MTSVPSTCPWPRGSDRSPAWHLRSRSGTAASDEEGRRCAGGARPRGRVAGDGRGRLGHGHVRHRCPAHGDVGRHLQDPARHAGALPGGGGDLPGPALDRPGRHRHRRVGQRAVEPPRGPQRRQCGGGGGAHAVRAGDILTRAYGGSAPTRDFGLSRMASQGAHVHRTSGTALRRPRGVPAVPRDDGPSGCSPISVGAEDQG